MKKPIIIVRYRPWHEPTQERLESGEYPKRRMQWRGLTIAIENEPGSLRRGASADGTQWERRMHYAYGEVLKTEGVDGDPVDVYIGPCPDTADMVYIVHQRRYGDWDAYDEDKCMIGFSCLEDATSAYLSCYEDPRFLGPVTAMPVDEFIKKVRATKDAPAMIKSVILLKTHVSGYTRADGTVVRPHEDRRMSHHSDSAPDDRIVSGVGDDLVTLYHGTGAREEIEASGKINAGHYFGGIVGVSLTPDRSVAEDFAGDGDVIQVRIPKSKLRIDPESYDEEDLDEALARGASVFALGDVYLRR